MGQRKDSNGTQKPSLGGYWVVMYSKGANWNDSATYSLADVLTRHFLNKYYLGSIWEMSLNMQVKEKGINHLIKFISGHQ